MLWDSTNKRILLYSGVLMDDPLNSLYPRNGEQWEVLSTLLEVPESDRPLAGKNAAAAWDPVRQCLFVTGGREPGDKTFPPGTAEWDGDEWRRRTVEGAVTTPPGGPTAYGMTWFPDLEVLFAHTGADVNEFLDTWHWDLAGWWEQEPTAEPHPRTGSSYSYCGGDGGRILRFGGRHKNQPFNDLWAWTGDDWALLAEADPDANDRPEPRRAASFAWDATRQVAVLFGGNNAKPQGMLNDTWEFGGENWSLIPHNDPEYDGVPSARFGAPLANDPESETMVLLNGRPTSSAKESIPWHDHWVHDGVGWVMKESILPSDPSTRPSQDSRFSSTWAWRVWYDPVVGDMVAAGHYGPNDKPTPLLVWHWDGSAWHREEWTDIYQDGRPENRHQFGMDYFAPAGKALLFGGSPNVFAGLNDTWYWDRGLGQRPGQVLRVSLAEAGLEDPSLYTGLKVTWHAGGTGFADQLETSGTSLLVWQEGVFAQKDSNAASPGNESPMTWSTEDPEVLARLPIGHDMVFGAAVVPTGTNWQEPAEVSTAYVEVTLRYHLEE